MQHIKKVSLKVIFIVILVWFFVFPIELIHAANSNQATWQFSSAEDFTISDESMVAFFDGSVKITPTGAEKAWARKWHDSHFVGTGSSGVYGLAVDDNGYIYIGGTTNDGA
ncbi:unnamed protein product, partial [marine sediment metagenome]